MQRIDRIDTLLREERERQRRINDTYMAVMALPSPERLQLVVRVLDETSDGAPARGRPVRRRARATATNGKPSIRQAIAEVLAAGGPLGARAITDRIQTLRPGTGLASVHGELMRMRGDQVVVQAGMGPNNGGLYTLNGSSVTGTT